MIRCRHIGNILDAYSSASWVAPAGGTVASFAPSGFDLRAGNLVTHNGRALLGQEVLLTVPADGDLIVFAEVPGIIGEIIGAVIISSAVTAIIDAVILIGISVGISYAIAALTAPDLSQTATFTQAGETSPSRGFRGIQTAVGVGVPIPLVFGEARTGGVLVDSFFQPRFALVDDTDPNVTRIAESSVMNPAVTRLHSRIAYAVGPVESLSSFEIDDNPVTQIRGLQHEQVLGTNIQRPLDGFSEAKLTNSVETDVTNSGGPVVRQTTVDVDTVELKLSFPKGLFEHNSEGQLIQTSVELKFEYKIATDAGWTTFKTVTFSDRITGPKTVWIRYPRLTRETYDIRVTRNTADNIQISPPKEDDSRWVLMQEVTSAERIFPGIAQVGFRQMPLAQQQVPQKYTALVKGFNDVRVYTTPTTFTKKWTDNPAWLCAYFLTHPDVGLGKFYTYEDDIDLPSFIDWAAWADEPVPSGRGVVEKRATFNLVVDEPIAAQDLLKLFSQSSGVFLVHVGGKWRAVIDRKDDMVQLFHEGNILPGTLTYAFVPTNQRASRLNVDFVNAERDYARDTFVQEDQDAADAQSMVDAQVALWGVTRPSQIARESVRLLNHNRLMTRTCQFEASIEAITIGIGQVFGLAALAGGIGVANGKLLRVDSSLTTFQLDELVTLDSGKTYEIVVCHKTDSRIQAMRLVNVTDDPTDVIEVASEEWDVQPQAGDGYSLGELTFAVEKFRLVDVATADRFTRKMSGVIYNDAIYDGVIASNPSTVVSSVPKPRFMPPPVTDLKLQARKPQDSAGNTIPTIDVDWMEPQTELLSHYEIWWRKTGDLNWLFGGTAIDQHYELSHRNLIDATSYDIAVLAVSPQGARLHIDDATTASVTTL